MGGLASTSGRIIDTSNAQGLSASGVISEKDIPERNASGAAPST